MKVNCTIPYDSLNTIVKSTCKKYTFKRSIYCNHFFDDKCYIEEEKAKYMKEFRAESESLQYRGKQSDKGNKVEIETDIWSLEASCLHRII